MEEYAAYRLNEKGTFSLHSAGRTFRNVKRNVKLNLPINFTIKNVKLTRIHGLVSVYVSQIEDLRMVSSTIVLDVAN